MRYLHPEPWQLLFIAAAVFTLGAVVGNCAGSMARAHAADDVTPAIALARLCVNESGMRAYVHGDCAAIHATLSFRAEHLYRTGDYLDALHRYSQRVTVDRRGRSRRWVADLWPDGREPASWCDATCGAWHGRHSARWARVYRHALDVYRGDVQSECYAFGDDDDAGPRVPLTPHGWARSDVRPADPTAHPIDCGDTLNTFWSVPRYARRWPLAPVDDPS